MASSFIIRESGGDTALADVHGQLAFAVERDAGRRVVSLSLRATARLDGEEAVFWLKRQGPVNDDRLARQHRVIEPDSGGFYCYEHAALENLAFVAFRKDQGAWRFVAVADLSGPVASGPRLEIDLDAAIVPAIDWEDR